MPFKLNGSVVIGPRMAVQAAGTSYLILSNGSAAALPFEGHPATIRGTSTPPFKVPFEVPENKIQDNNVQV